MAARCTTKKRAEIETHDLRTVRDAARLAGCSIGLVVKVRADAKARSAKPATPKPAPAKGKATKPAKAAKVPPAPVAAEAIEGVEPVYTGTDVQLLEDERTALGAARRTATAERDYPRVIAAANAIASITEKLAKLRPAPQVDPAEAPDMKAAAKRGYERLMALAVRLEEEGSPR